MKYFVCFSLFVLPFFSFAQEQTINVHPEVTTHVVLAEQIRHVDVSTDRLAVHKVNDHLLLIKPLSDEVQFVGVLTLTGETALYQWEVLSSEREKADRYVQVDSQGLPILSSQLSNEKLKQLSVQMISEKIRKPVVKSKELGLTLRLNALRLVDQVLLLDIEIQNDSDLVFDMQALTLCRQAERLTRRTNVQQVLITPSFSLHSPRKVIRQYRTILAIQTSELFSGHELQVTAREHPGGRLISLPIPYRLLLSADAY